jgi:hypothetical protein
LPCAIRFSYLDWTFGECKERDCGSKYRPRRLFIFHERFGPGHYARFEIALEHFPAKWRPLRVAKMRQYKEIEPLSDSTETEIALEAQAAERSIDRE